MMCFRLLAPDWFVCLKPENEAMDNKTLDFTWGDNALGLVMRTSKKLFCLFLYNRQLLPFVRT